MIDPENGADDKEFFAEVDAFIDSLPADSGRVKRIADGLPERFDEVLRRRGELTVDAGPSPALAFPSASDWNWSVIAASIAIAAALVGMGLLWLIGEGADPPGAKQIAQPLPSTEEVEFVVTIDSDGEADIIAQSGRSDAIAATGTGGDAANLRVGSSSAEATGGTEPWYLRAPVSPPLPETSDPEWALAAIDRFALAAMEERGIEPLEAADRLTLLRRLSFDLTGLPPSPELVEHFLHNQSPAAYGSVVEELMATWQFGEHWAGRWLELAGYDGGDADRWRYREYVIASLNGDKRFDRFVTEQLAGDLIHLDDIGERAEAHLGTGFLVAPDAGQAAALVDRVASALLGIQAGGADGQPGSALPLLSERDHQAMAGIFASSRIDYGLDLRLDPKRFPIANLVEDDRWRSESKRVRGLLASGERRLARAEDRRDRVRVRRLRAEVANLRSDLLGIEVAMRDQIVSSGSEFVGAGERRRTVNVGGVPRGLPESVPDTGLPPGVSGRFELAKWLVDPSHPVTARVFVDRVWGELFGSGLIGAVAGSWSPAEPPHHPDLLDYLAADFSSGGWSVKRLVKEMVMSRTYQMAGGGHDGSVVSEAPSGLPWRRYPKALDDVELRDAIMSVAGWSSPAAAWDERMFARGEFGVIAGLQDERAYRSIYLKDQEPVDEGVIFEAAVAASRQMLVSGRAIDTDDLVSKVFVNTLTREPSSEEAAWATEVIGRAGSLEDGGVLGAVLRPDRLGDQAAYLEGLLPRVTVRLEAADRSGDGVVSWAMLYYALMRTEEFRQVR
ncbi:MAG: DUF1549 domain-containing protein [Verrucomicrobiales bacterium]